MLVDELLTAIAVQHQGKAVEAGDGAPQLEAVHQKYRDGKGLLAHLGEKNFL